MSQKFRGKGGKLVVVALALASLLATATGVYATEPVGVVTEIDVRGGLAEIRRLGLQEWRLAGPLLTLNAGDTVRVSQGASVVILLSGGRGSLKVDASNSPFQIPAVLPTAEQSKVRRGWILLDESFKALVKASNDSAQGILGTRGRASALTILTPHNGLVLPDSLVFEWTSTVSVLQFLTRAICAKGRNMKELVFALQFKGKARPVEGVEGKLAAKTTAAGQVLRTALTSKGVQAKAESKAGPRATFESEVQMTGPGTFIESGRISYGKAGGVTFKTVGQGVLGASGVDGLQRGAVIWEVTEGRGQFARATGLITSNFTVGSKGEVVDNHYVRLFLPA